MFTQLWQRFFPAKPSAQALTPLHIADEMKDLGQQLATALQSGDFRYRAEIVENVKRQFADLARTVLYG